MMLGVAMGVEEEAAGGDPTGGVPGSKVSFDIRVSWNLQCAEESGGRLWDIPPASL